MTSALVAACDRNREFVAKDTERRAFSVLCPEGSECHIVAAKTSASDRPVPTLSRAGRVIGVCDSSDGAYDCRPLSCESEDDCPHERDRVVECSRGFCVQPDRAYTREDVVMLCLAGTGVGHDLAVQRERYARALESGEPPRVPGGCSSP